MGNKQSYKKINFEDIQLSIVKTGMYTLINTLNNTDQTCLIPNTIQANQEEITINNFLKNKNKNINIIIYGYNYNDDNIYKKYDQLIMLGFENVFIYPGGMFEWLILQDIYGFDEFPTTIKELDFLKYKPCKTLSLGGFLEY